jgi:L-iditol 2-dehydrogenase
MTAPGKIEFCEVARPQPGEEQVLVRIMRIGVCGSDLHVYRGTHPYTSYPVVQGHEVSGVIAELGRGVTGLAVGEKVTIQPQVTCGECYSCRNGDYHICDSLKVMGFQTTGAASEFFAVDATKVLKLPDELSLDEGAMVEPLAVAVHALGRAGGAAGKKVLVLGAGPIGNLVAQAAKGTGAQSVMISDLSDYRLGLAKACGVDCTVNPSTADLGEALRAAFGKDRADLTLECVGVEATMEQAIRLARKGTQIVVVGVFGEKAMVDLGSVQDRELKLIGTLMYQEKDYRKAIELAAAGKVDLKPLITDHFAFRDYLAAYQHIEARRSGVLKVIIDVEGG